MTVGSHFSQKQMFRGRAFATFSAVIVAVVLGTTAIAAPAIAADTGSLRVTKLVNGRAAATVAPGGEFTYTIATGCDDNDCVNTTLSDPLPAQFAGFQIVSTTISPAASPSTKAYTGGCATSGLVTADCTLGVAFREYLGNGAVGIKAGETYTTSITLKVPLTLPPTWPSNGVAVPNVATAQSDTAATVQSPVANVTVNIPITVSTALSKTWSPATQQFSPGAQSTITLSSQNTSNVNATSLVVQDPTTAVAGATTLDPSNPFTVSALQGFGTVVLPAGATTVQVDAYTLNDDGTYTWKAGAARAPGDIALPARVANADVAGLRFTYADDSGATLTPNGAAGVVPLTVAQLATKRGSTTSLVTGASVTNQASDTVAVPGQTSKTVTATAPYRITPLSASVAAAKSITPGSIPAGTTAAASITGTNQSNGPLDTLTIADEGYFTADLLFGGFSGPLAYPSGATGATVKWIFSDGSSSAVAFANGATPVAPTPPTGVHLTGFDLTYTGAIASGAAATAPFAVAPTVDIVTEAQGSVQTTNTITVSGANVSGPATPATASAPLQIFSPQIGIALDKTLAPTTPVAPGGTVVSSLKTTTNSSTAFVDPNTIVVTDGARSGVAGDFWGAFNPTSIASTQVPAGASLLIEYTTDGSTYQTLATVPASDGGQVYRGNLPANLIGSVTGLRFTFTNDDGFPAGTTVTPNTAFQARSTIRGTGTPTSVADANPSSYTNLATAQATGDVTGLPTLTSPVVQDGATAQIQTFSGTGQLLADKNWTTPTFSGDLPSVDSQSGQQAGTSLGWGVNATGYGSIVVTDPDTGQDSPQQTTFQAFDLKAVAPVAFTADALLEWDSVSTVELYENGAWTTITPPSGSWMTGAGFAGYTLSAGESAATTGIRLTVVPNDAARTASTDPLAPAPGSGISPSSTARHFNLLWQLRNTVRVNTAPSTPWVNATHGYNVAGSPGVVSNTDSVGATLLDGTAVAPRLASDTISILDQPPGVNVTKSSQKASVVVPQPGDVPQSGYPTNTFSVVASNTSTARASSLRVSDPMPCPAGATASCTSAANGWNTNPYDGIAYSASNPFDRLNLTKLAFTLPSGQVDPLKSIVTLQHYSGTGEDTTTTQLTITQARALTAAQLADVVGVSALYQGTSPQTTGGTIGTGSASRITMTLSTQVRTNLRSDASTFTTPGANPFPIDNYTFAQSYDPVLSPTSTPTANARATLQLSQGRLDITSSKSISPSTLLEVNRTHPVTVTLGATQGPLATVSTNQVTITDDDQAFWGSFRLTGLSTSDVTLPAGANEVRVDVQLGQSTTWTDGAFAPAAALPAGIDPTQVSGVRFVFDNSSGALLSNTAPPTTWTATAKLQVALLDDQRGTTTAVPFPATIADTVQGLSHRTNDADLYPDATNQANANIFLDPGTFQLDVSKTPQNGVHTVTVGDSVPWTLTFQNTGTGFLSVPEVVDSLPASLDWDGTAPTFTDSTGGLLGTTGITTDYSAADRTLTFIWPTTSQRMAPNETVAVTLGIILQPGLTADQTATNQFVVNTTQTLAACTNDSGNGQGTLAGLSGTHCGSSNYVQPTAGPALFTSKGVKGDVVDPIVSGATNVNDPSATCLTDSDGYYKSPCAANSVVGGTDQWKMLASNSGTVPYTSLTLVDPLPFQGDTLLATGSPRASNYRPTFDEAFGMQFTAPAGTTTTWQVTTSANVCGSGATTTWTADPTCSSSTWTTSSSFTGSWAAVTGLRVIMDFTTTPTRQLSPGQTVQALFRTVDTQRTAADTTLAPTATPVPTTPASSIPQAWNQFGAVALPIDGGDPIPGAPVKAGVELAGGPLQVTKALTGPAASAAPTSFDANVACTVAGVHVDLGSLSTLTLDAAGGYSATVPGIPLGSTCEVREAGAAGSNGEAARSISTPSVRILTPAPVGAGSGDAATAPADQTVTITNDYEFGQLTLDKTAQAAAVRPGDDVTYDIVVTNTGGLDARDFTVSDLLPAGARFVSADESGAYDPASGDVTWRVAELATGAKTTVTVTLGYPSVGSYTNHATVSSPNGLTPFARALVVDPCLTATADACAPVTVSVTAPVTGDGGGTGAGTGVGGSGGTGLGPAGRSGSGSGPTAGTGGVGSVLAFTGSNPVGVLFGGLAIVMAGLVLVIARRARRRRVG